MRLEGMMPPLVTNYDENGEVTTAGLEEQLAFYIEAGCTGFFVGASTGEGVLQTAEERCRYLEAVVKIVSGKATVIAQVGAASTREACELAQRAARIGADVVSSVMPFYFVVGPEAAADHYRAISDAADLPFLLYYLESATKAEFTTQIFTDHFAEIPRLVGMKFSGMNLEIFGRIAEFYGDRISMLIGPDQFLLPALTLGARGSIATSYNYMPEIAVGVYRHYRAGELEAAQALMRRQFSVIHLLLRKYPMLGATREIMRMRGMETGRPRGPLPRMTAEQTRQLRVDLEALDFFSGPIR